MKKLIIFLIILPFIAFAHEDDVLSHDNNFIIDTDMGMDDIRAVTYFTKMHNVNIFGFVATDGVQSPTRGATNLRKILKEIDTESQVYQGMISNAPAPKMRDFIYSLDWKSIAEVDANNQPVSKLADRLNQSKQRFTYVAMGPLTNLAYLLQRVPDLKDRIDAIYFSGGIPGHFDKELFNFNRDTTAARYVMSQNIPLYAFVSKSEDLPIFDNRTWNRIFDSKNTHIRMLNKLFGSKDVIRHMFIKQGLFNAYDDIIPVYVERPKLAVFDEKNENLKILFQWNKTQSNNIYFLRMKQTFQKNLIPSKNVSFDEFPISHHLYSNDISRNIDLLLELYGLEELKSVIITNELHSHLGSYSIIGVKMGLRARELLVAEVDKISVISNIGSKPPASCMNDGIQVATGATLGRGNIEVKDNGKYSAVFLYNNKKVTLELKKEIVERMEKQVAETIESHGNLTEDYFEHIRRIAINNWIDLDRSKIFNETLDEAKPGRN